MCGIFGYIGNRKDAPHVVFEGLKLLEYRGYDSWGIGVVNGNGFKIYRRVGKIDKEPNLINSLIAVGHNRWATHGAVTEKNAHPHLDCTKKIAVVHNGIIENFQNLKQDLISKGHNFISQTDTEVFPHLIEEYINLGFLQATKKAFSRLRGRNAFVVVDSQDKEMIGIRDGSPLVFGIGSGEYFLASDVPAFLAYTKNVIFLDDKQGVIVSNKGWEIFGFSASKKVKKKAERISWDIAQAKKGKYEHFLLKEILEQPTTIRASAAQSANEIEKLAQAIRKAYGSYLVACGTASYAALYGTYVFSTVARKHINWAMGSEFPDYQHFITPASLVITVSQSGETADTLDAANIAKKKGAKTAAIVNVMGSSLMRTSDFSLMINAGPEMAVISTKAFTAQLSVLLLLAYATINRFIYGKSLIEKTAKALQKMLNDDFLKNIKRIAQTLKDKDHIYLIGKGQNYPIALEGALKIKEASYIHGEGFAAGELKHGPITLIEKKTPCIALFGNDSDKDYILGSTAEVKARGGYVIGIGPEENEIFDEFIKVPDISAASAIINTPAVQLLAYYLAVLKGNNPDRPRNLAKSVTVK